MWKSRITLLALTLCFPAASGCTPPAEPVWHGNSESFIFSRPDGSVVQYDVASQAERNLFPAGVWRPRRVGISPDGQKVAIGMAGWTENGRGVGIQIMQLADGGTMSFESRKWGNLHMKSSMVPTSTFWCPSGKRILVNYPTTGSTEPLFGKFVVYNVSTKKMRELDATPPAAMFTSYVGASPLRPDGAGYLAMTLGESGPNLSFVDWDGWEHDIAIERELRPLVGKLGDETVPNREKLMNTFPIPRGTWQGKAFEFRTKHGLVRIDTGSRVATLEPLPQDHRTGAVASATSSDSSRYVYQAATFSGGEYQLRCTAAREGHSGPTRIELLDLERDRRRTLLEGMQKPGVLGRPLIPAPDGEHVLVSIAQGGRSWIYVIGEDGSIVDKLDAGKAEVAGE